MNGLDRTFPGRRHVLLPVIDVESESQALRNAVLAREGGCDGVFLINHEISAPELLNIHEAVVKQLPDWWVGVNCLDLSPREVFAELPQEVTGVWVDDAEIDECAQAQPAARTILAARKASSWKGLYFGGVAFKYQRAVEDLATAARVAAKYMDVVTTSGPGTGQAASIEKIRAMKSAMGDSPLAIASGITPENVSQYLGVADCYLVATGISSSWTEFDPHRVRDLVQTVRSAT